MEKYFWYNITKCNFVELVDLWMDLSPLRIFYCYGQNTELSATQNATAYGSDVNYSL